MTSESLPGVVEPEYLTDALRRSGTLRDGRVCNVVVENSKSTVLSRIVRLCLFYAGAASSAPGSLILKTGVPERVGAQWNSGRQEVAFYMQVATQMSAPLVPRCFDAAWDDDTNNWHLLLEDLTNSHFTLASWPMPPTLEQSERIIAVRARFHAGWSPAASRPARKSFGPKTTSRSAAAITIASTSRAGTWCAKVAPRLGSATILRRRCGRCRAHDGVSADPHAEATRRLAGHAPLSPESVYR
jgi:hypothetical protein